MDYGLIDMRMDRSGLKELTRMGNLFLPNIETEMVL